MEKKIIAIISVAVLLASVFTACGKKKPMISVGDNEYPVATDSEGNTILNENGDVVIYVTDENGKYVKDDKGERETAAVTFPEMLVNDRTLETPYYRITMPEGWSIDSNGKITKDGNDKMHIKIYNFGELEENETLDTYFNKQVEMTKGFTEAFQTKYPDTSYNVAAGPITARQVDSRVLEFKVADNSGNVIGFTQSIYYMSNDMLFKVEYSCNEGGYDSSVNFVSLINDNLKIKVVSGNN